MCKLLERFSESARVCRRDEEFSRKTVEKLPESVSMDFVDFSATRGAPHLKFSWLSYVVGSLGVTARLKKVLPAAGTLRGA